MTQAEKAKRYDETLEQLKGLIECTREDKCTIVEEDIIDIFPELQESDDERIKQKFIKLVKMSSEVGGFALHKWEADEMLTWLEKQGKEEYALKSFKDEDVHKFMQYIEKEAKAYEFNLPNRGYDIYAFAKDILVWLEKQGKPKWSDDDEQYLLVCKNALRKYQVSDKWDAEIISKWLEDKLKH